MMKKILAFTVLLSFSIIVFPQSNSSNKYEKEAKITNSEKWEYTSSDLLAGRSQAGCALLDNKIYVIGGSTELATPNTFVNTNYAYDLNSNTCAEKASLPSALNAPQVCAYNGKIYCFGGRLENKTPSNQSLVYDPSNNLWSILANLPTPRFLGNAVVVNNKIYVIGGAIDNNTFSDKVEMYDPTSNTWATKQSMPHAISSFSMTVYNNKIYVIGGIYNATNQNYFFEYDPSANTWTTLNSLMFTIASASVEVIGDNLYLLGGKKTRNGSPIDDVYKYNFIDKTWKQESNMLLKISQQMSVTDGTRIFIAGGLLETITYVDRIQVYTPERPASIETQFTNIDYNVYPNPNNGSFFIQNPNRLNLEIKTINPLGEIVSSFRTSEYSINVTMKDCISGLYLVEIINLENGTVSVYKVIKN